MAYTPEQSASGEHASIKTILLVEDDATIGEVFVQAITQETNHLVIAAGTGFEALQIVKNIKPDLFILDYQLPRINGIELYDQLHVMDDFAQTPTIMLSARLPEKELVGRKIVGMHKPVDLDDFLQKIDELLG